MASFLPTEITAHSPEPEREEGLRIPTGIPLYETHMSAPRKIDENGMHVGSHTGIFCSNNGVYAIVDGKGNLFLAPVKEGYQQKLTDAGFRYEFFHVPHVDEICTSEKQRYYAEWLRRVSEI